MGSKYEFKPDKNPGAGTYNIDSGLKLTKPRTVDTIILSGESNEKHDIFHVAEHGPAPGAYHKNESFNRLKANVGFGSKYEFKADSNPAVGSYDVYSGLNHT